MTLCKLLTVKSAQYTFWPFTKTKSIVGKLSGVRQKTYYFGRKLLSYVKSIFYLFRSFTLSLSILRV